jgi:hypothetical protein
MSSRARCLFSTVLFVLASLACGGDPPDKEMQQARGAIEAARAAGADRYAAYEFKAAAGALNNAEVAVDQRDYRLALNHALDSMERAQNAAKQAADGKAIARVHAERAIAAATTAVAGAVAKVKAAQSARVPARVVTATNAAIADARERVQEARTAFEAGDYHAASSAASAAVAAMKAATDTIVAAASQPVRRRGESR